MRRARRGSGWRAQRASVGSMCGWWRRARSRRVRVIGSRPTVVTRSGWCDCWLPTSCRSRSFSTVGDEHSCDMVRCIDDIRGDLMRSRHRLGKFLLRRGERFPGPGGAWTVTHMRWLRTLRFADACSCATFADYLAAVELLIGRRRTLLELLEQQSCECSHAPVIARLRCF